MRTTTLLAVSLVIGVPTSVVLTFLSTPYLWRLEPILGIKLAGHSGPEDWVFEVNIVAMTLLFFLLLRWLTQALRRNNQ
jgi:hypothetical protein